MCDREAIKCPHTDVFDDGEGLWCVDCHRYIAWECDACNGDGYVFEDDYECDWGNYGHKLIACPECGGCGYMEAGS